MDAFNRGDRDALRRVHSRRGGPWRFGLERMGQGVPSWRKVHEAFALQLNVESIIAGADLVTMEWFEFATGKAIVAGTFAVPRHRPARGG